MTVSSFSSMVLRETSMLVANRRLLAEQGKLYDVDHRDLPA
jgi:hypothetical protein